jgi:hypothetical protein
VAEHVLVVVEKAEELDAVRMCECVPFRFNLVGFGPITDNPERGVMLGRDRVKRL